MARRRSHRRRNSPHGRRRRYTSRARRRNPVARLSGISLWRPMTYLPKLGTAAVGGMTSASAPSMLFGPGVSTTTAYLTQIGVGLGGAAVISWFRTLGPVHGFAWLIGSVIGVVQEPIRRAIAAASPAPVAVVPANNAVARYPGMARYPTLGAMYYAGAFGRYYSAPRAVFAQPAFGLARRAMPAGARALRRR